jgi:hypothetical protein
MSTDTQFHDKGNRDIPEEVIQSLLDKDLGPEGKRITALIKRFTRRFTVTLAVGVVMLLVTLGLLTTAVFVGVTTGLAAAVPFMFFTVAGVAVIVAMVKMVRLAGAQTVYLYECLEALDSKRKQD